MDKIIDTIREKGGVEKFKGFEDYLQFKHAQEYQGLDDDMQEAFEKWLGELDVSELIVYADEYKAI